MEILSRIRGLADLNIVASGQLQEALHTRARMFGALAFITVGQKKDKAGEQVPLIFSGADELIDDGLRDIGEVAKLGFPQDQSFGIVATVSVFKSHHPRFRERRVVDIARRLVGVDMTERNIFRFVLNIEQGGMALIEGCTARVLAAEANRN